MIMYLTKSYLESSVDPNDLLINTYNLLRADCPCNLRKSVLCLHLILKKRIVILRLIDTAFLGKITIQNLTG